MSPTDHAGRRRVAITGIGVKAPGGTTVDDFWTAVLAGRGLARGLTRFDPAALAVRIGAEVDGFDPAAYCGPKEARRMDRATQLGFAAAMDAVTDAGLPPDLDRSRAAVLAGTGVGGLMTLEEQVGVLLGRGPDRVSPLLVPMMMANATAGSISIHLGWTGPNLCVATACAAGAHAIGEAVRLLRQQGKKVLCLAYVGCDGSSPERSADFGIAYPDPGELGAATTGRWRWRSPSATRRPTPGSATGRWSTWRSSTSSGATWPRRSPTWRASRWRW